MSAMSKSPTDRATPLFDVVLYPHRSLSPRGFALLMASLISTMALVGLYFAVLGAWPVLPFFGAEVILIFFAFRLNARDARTFETLRLTQDALTVEQVRPSGRRHKHSFQPPHWLRIDLAKKPGGATDLILSSHGDSIVVGRFLSVDERREIARELRAALKRLVGPMPAPSLDGQP